jgi:hypothetical protein
MGLEAACRYLDSSRTLTGKAYLETDHLQFRGEQRFRIELSDVTGVRADGGLLHFEVAGVPAALELGAQAEKWAEKILHPPTLFEKLGIKPGQRISVTGSLPESFTSELGEYQPRISRDSDLIFIGAEDRTLLERLPSAINHLKRDGAIWVVYPKGVDIIREKDVLLAGRAVGLKDIKVASFSATHTALKFVRPKLARG